MKQRTFKVPRPVCFCLVLSFTMLLVPALLIPFWVNKVRIIEGRIKVHASANVKDVVLQSHFHKNIKFGFMLIILMMVALAVSIFTFVILTIRSGRREMYLCSALIKQMEATHQAERTSTDQSTAFGDANHDVRGSLAGITGLIWMCRAHASPGSKLVEYLNHMESRVDSLLALLNKILDESKIKEGKKQLVEEEFKMDELLEDIVYPLYTNGVMKNVDVILDPCDGSVARFSRVKGDKIQLQRILNNLLQNADKFTSEGHITLRAWARKPSFDQSSNLTPNTSNTSTGCMSCLRLQSDEASVELRVLNKVQQDPKCVEFIFEVDDTGKGIPKEKQKSVFENYVQVNDQTTSVHGSQAGTGLGLGITQSLKSPWVRLMGGEIGIGDKGIGEKGTCFRFNIFLIACDQPQAQDHEAISVNYAREDDLESQLGGGYTSSDSYYSITSHQKPENSNVILFIKEEERCRVLRGFMMNIIGLKVHVINRRGKFSQTLEKLKRKIINFASYNSSSSGKSKEIPLRALDGTDIDDRGRGLIRFILIIVDTSVGLTREISRAMAEFRKDFPKNVSLRVVWLDKPGVDEDKLPSTDIVIAKPLHGSDLYRALEFVPEFRDKFLPPTVTQEEMEDETTSRMKIQQPLMNPPLEAKRQDVSVDVNGSSSNNLPLTGKKILVVEDDNMLLMICLVVVSKLGATTYTCGNGEEALDLVRKGLSDQRDIGPSTPSPPFDYILMDCQMAVMDGFEATKCIREEEAHYGIRIPIIALTAHTKEVTDKIFQAGMDYYIEKPISDAKLLKAIDYIEHRNV
ncbi:histidine kinase CKI1-like [Lycium ferocissimum]|uniref:histidine kinase CKI1-like n=1 Tax=Lycium ferocissimum TaxID=112874 RepID=UPI002814CFB1|nr:histidine kinase CKI1-like [Lycium ferocissimum]